MNHDIVNHADGNTSYAAVNDTDMFIVSLEEASKSFFNWFENNLMRSNVDKCHFLISSNEKVTIK